MIYVFGWLMCGIVSAMIGAKKGEGCGAFILGVLLGPFGILISIFSKGNRKTCPYCKELIHKDAKVCSHCQRDIPLEPTSSNSISAVSKTNFIIIAITVGFIVIGLAGYYLTKSSSNTPPTQTTSFVAEKPNKLSALKELYGSTGANGNVKLPSGKLARTWFDQTFQDGNEQIYVVFIYEQGVDEKGELLDCHSCIVSINAVTYKVSSGGWTVSKQSGIAELGYYGHPPEADHGDILNLSQGNTALLIKGEDGGQGTIDEYREILAYKNNDWKYLGGIIISSNNKRSAECEDTHKCFSYIGNISTELSNNPQYPNIIVSNTGTKYDSTYEHIIPASKTVYAFNGKEYADINKVAVQQEPTVVEHPAETQTISPQQNSTSEAALFEKLTSCIDREAQSGAYSSYDGGQSTRQILEVMCKDVYEPWAIACLKEGGTTSSCVLKSAGYSQLMLKRLNK